MRSFGVMIRTCSAPSQDEVEKRSSFSAVPSSDCFAQSCVCAAFVESALRALCFRRRRRRPPPLREKICTPGDKQWQTVRSRII